MDLIIRNILIRKAGKDLVDIAINDGKITEIKSNISEKGNEEVDAGGNLVTESYINGHLHLCKVYTLDMEGQKVIEIRKEGWKGTAAGQHCRAMCLYPENQFRKLCALLKTAKMGVISDPQTGPLAARVQDLLKEGIPVGLGQDDINDAYYTFGQNNMLEVAFLGAHLLRMCSYKDLELVYDMITTKAAEVINIPNHELKVGGNADLVITTQKDVVHAIWYHEEPKVVIKGGKIIKK